MLQGSKVKEDSVYLSEAITSITSIMDLNISTSPKKSNLINLQSLHHLKTPDTNKIMCAFISSSTPQRKKKNLPNPFITNYIWPKIGNMQVAYCSLHLYHIYDNKSNQILKGICLIWYNKDVLIMQVIPGLQEKEKDKSQIIASDQ